MDVNKFKNLTRNSRGNGTRQFQQTNQNNQGNPFNSRQGATFSHGREDAQGDYDVIHQVFQQNILSVIKEITAPLSDVGDNNSRAEVIHDACRKIGLKPGGTGTNRTTVYHPNATHLIFKIGLDEKGIQNNIDEYELFISDDFLQKFTTKTYGYAFDGLICVSERVKVMDRNDMEYYYNQIINVLEDVSRYYVFDDAGPEQFLNWGLVGGEAVILDYAEFVSRSEVRFECLYENCLGDLKYNDDFSKIICDKCGEIYRISEIKNDKKSTGPSSAIDAMRQFGYRG